MFFGVLVLLFALAGLAAASLAVREYYRAAKANTPTTTPSSAAIILTGTTEKPIPLVLLRSLSMSDQGHGYTLCIARTPDDIASEKALKNLQVPAKVSEQVLVPMKRAFPPTWLQMKALEACPTFPSVVAIVDNCARPAAREPWPIMATIAKGYEVVSPHPVPAPDTFWKRFLCRSVADVSPLLFALFGPLGLPPIFLAVDREALAKALSDPLTQNRLNLAQATLFATERSRSLLLPKPLGVSCSKGEPSFFQIMALHLAMLARLSALRMITFAAGIIALPAALVQALLDFASLSAMGLGLSLIARLLLGVTWAKSVHGSAVSFLLSPVRDLLTFIFLTLSVFRSKTLSCGQLFLVRKEGILVPAPLRQEYDCGH